MQNAANAYAKVSKQTASPRDLEASLLLKAASRLQVIKDSWDANRANLDEALLYNRKLWTIFMSSVARADNPLPRETRQNVANLGLFVMNHTLSATYERRPEQLTPLISINRELAAGLMARV
jgi:flagellar protein FlaF